MPGINEKKNLKNNPQVPLEFWQVRVTICISILLQKNAAVNRNNPGQLADEGDGVDAGELAGAAAGAAPGNSFSTVAAGTSLMAGGVLVI